MGRSAPPDKYGVRLPTGFKARLIGYSDELVPGTTFAWVREPDGAACFPLRNGGWIYAANSEVNGTGGGAAAIVFSAAGEITDAYRILGETKWNCSGGATPWGTWLSGEEFRQGYVWECDPTRPGQGVARKLLGRYAHEAAVVDPATGWVYLTEDAGKGRLYRFRPDDYGDLSAGVLEAAKVNNAGDKVSWVEVSTKQPERSANTSEFNRGEGAYFSGGHVYFTTTGDDKVWALNTTTDAIEVIYDAAELGDAAPLRDPDCLTVHQTSGDIYVGEDADDLQLVLLADGERNRVAAPFVQLVGHGNGENGKPRPGPELGAGVELEAGVGDHRSGFQPGRNSPLHDIPARTRRCPRHDLRDHRTRSASDPTPQRTSTALSISGRLVRRSGERPPTYPRSKPWRSTCT